VATIDLAGGVAVAADHCSLDELRLRLLEMWAQPSAAHPDR